MNTDLYEALQQQLDQYAPFPRTESGVERRILQKLFSPEEARIFLAMTLLPEPVEAVAERLEEDPEHTKGLLDRMVEKGLVFRRRKGDDVRYAAVPFVVGLYEFQLKRMDPEFARLCEAYFEDRFGSELSRHMALMRPIPVNRSIPVSWPVAPYDDAERLFEGKTLISVADCICRVQRGLVEHPCDKPLEVCFQFGSHARYYLERGMGREVSREEALDILRACEEAGLVLQPFNAQNPGGLCNCCGDCCAMLRSLKKHPKPAEMTLSNYYAVVDPERCVACETCVERCQMEAVTLGEEETAQVDLDRCIGCGLCVSTCPSDAVHLQPKPEDRRGAPPVSGRETFMRLAELRGTRLAPLSFRRGGGSS